MGLNAKKDSVGRRRFLPMGISLTAAMLVGSLASPGFAIPVETDYDDEVYIHGGSYSHWGYIVNDSYSGCFADSNTFSMDDAEFWTGGPPGTGTNRQDAFNTALQFIVDGTEFVDSNSVIDKEDEEVTAGPESVEGLRTWVTYTALPEKPIIRVLLKVRNNGSTAKNRTIVYDNNLGSGPTSDVRDTSSGDDNQGSGDRWLVSSDNGTTPGDAVLTWSLFGPGPVREKVDDVVCQPGDSALDSEAVDYEIRVPADSVRYLLMFVRLSSTNGQGSNAAADFDQEKSFLFKGLNQAVRDRVLNWNL
jgi:hypothetical protein